MTALTQPFEAARKPGDTVLWQVGAGQKIYKGAMVVTRADGYAYSLRAPAASQPDTFIGFADETQDNTNGTAGALSIHVLRTGTFLVNKSSAQLTDLSQPFYGVDDATVSSTSTNAVLVGYATEIINSGQIRIDIVRAVQ